MKKTNDINIKNFGPLIPPVKLKELFPMTENANKTVVTGRQVIKDIIAGKDKRMLAIVGPCSIHDEKAALEYALKLKHLSEIIDDKIFIIMRVYFEKPRTTIGWKGLITDPHLDGSYDIESGLKIARNILLNINELGLPIGSEMLDPIIPQYISDLISWAAIGARTTESQTHREMASGLSMPVGFKNGTSGNIKMALDAIESTRFPHKFIGIDQNGHTSIIETNGNNSAHIILRGGRSGPNYYEEFVEEAELLMKSMQLNPAIIIDCSHSNSSKDYKKQRRVLNSLIYQRIGDRKSIIGFMIESSLFSGKQKITDDISELEYGVSITDECVGWDETKEMLLYAYEKLK